MDRLKTIISWYSHRALDLLDIQKIAGPNTKTGLAAAEKIMVAEIDTALLSTEGALFDEVHEIIYNNRFKTFSKSEVNKVLKKVTRRIESYAPDFVQDSIPTVFKEREGFYKNVTENLSDRLKVAPTFTLKDEKALSRLGKFDKWWIGENYNNKVTKQVFSQLSNIPKHIPLTQGDIANYLFQNVTEITKSKQYWEVFANNALNRARSYSSMRTFEETAILEYEISSVLDERTSKFCETVDGTTMDVDIALKNWEKIDQAKDPDEIKEIMRWGGEDKEGAFVKVNNDKIRIYRGMAGADLQALGLDAPPYHGLCRTGVLPLF